MARPTRKPNRLHNFDYSSNGYYFVTICTKGKVHYFGSVRDRSMHLNANGRIVQKCWDDLPNHYVNCRLDEFVIMPNHIHGILIIKNYVGNGLKPFRTASETEPIHTRNKHSLSEIVRGLKTFSSRRINALHNPGYFSWQKSFYDHIIRTETSLHEIRQYIRYNPLKWYEDPENSDRHDQ